MIARSLSLVVLTVGASVAWLGCQPSVQPPVGNQKTHPAVQKKGGPKAVRSKLDEDSFRVRLLMVEAVQKELCLTADQIGKLRDCAKTSEARSREFLAKSHEILPPSRSFSQEEFEARKQKFRALSDDLKSKGNELRTQALAMLTPGQSERLKQIQLQVTIPASLTRREIIKALNISEEQSAKIRALRDDMDQKHPDEWPDLRDLNPKERRQKLIEFMERSNEAQVGATKRILEVLTPGQRTEFEKLLGKKIDVARLYEALIPDDAEF
jgi:Spy/CpxP family protein refolding chaperone